MKSIKNLAAIFEQEIQKGQAIELLGPSEPNPSDEVRIQWPYSYSWPISRGELDTFADLVNTLTKSDNKGVKNMLASISAIDNTHTVGISKDSKTSVNAKLFGKDQQQKVGFIYVFNPGVIDVDKIPTNKTLPKITDKFTFIADSSINQYYGSGETSTASSQSNPTKTAIKYSDLINVGNDYYAWWNAADEGPYSLWIKPTIGAINTRYKKLADDYRAAINNNPNYTGELEAGEIGTATPVAQVFWALIGVLPDGLKTDIPGGKTSTYSYELKAAIEKIISAATQYDQAGFSSVNTSILDSRLYNYVAAAAAIVGLNKGDLDPRFLPKAAKTKSDPYYKGYEFAYNTATSPSFKGAASSSTQSNLGGSSTFDGSSIKTEDQLLQILAGAIADSPAAFGTPNPATYDSLATAKTLFSANMGGSGYANLLAALKRYSSFDHGKSYPNSDGFKDFENTINSTRTGKFDDALLTRIKTLISKSPIK